MKNKCTILIVIVDYFKADRVIENTLSLLDQDDCPVDIKISITDNSCDQKNREKLSQLDKYDNVYLQFSDKNSGYIAACNNAAQPYDAKYILLVNPDITWNNKKTLSSLIDFMDKNPGIGITGPRQINDDGSTPGTVRRFPNILAQIARRSFLKNLPFLKDAANKYELNNFDYNKSQYVDWIQSSLLIIRGDLWKKTNGLDHRYFLFMSDPEICFKAWELNYRVFYNADLIVGADGKRCSEGGFNKILTSRSLQYHILDAIKYQLKHLVNKRPKNTDYSQLVK